MASDRARVIRAYHRRAPAVVGVACSFAFALLGGAGVLVEVQSHERRAGMGVLTGIVMLVVGLWATHRFLRSGTIKAYETGLRYRGVTNSKRLSWASVDSFVCTPGRSGYGGRGVVLSVVVADGKQLIKFGEFWAPEDAGSRFWPDCEGICSELNELLAAYRRSADMSTGGDDQRPEQ